MPSAIEYPLTHQQRIARRIYVCKMCSILAALSESRERECSPAHACRLKNQASSSLYECSSAHQERCLCALNCLEVYQRRHIIERSICCIHRLQYIEAGILADVSLRHRSAARDAMIYVK